MYYYIRVSSHVKSLLSTKRYRKDLVIFKDNLKKNVLSGYFSNQNVHAKEELFDHHHDHVDDVGVRKSLWKSLLEIFCE